MPSQPSLRRRCLRLMLSIAALAVVWTIILPRIATMDRYRLGEQRFRELGINPSALFYTDHPRTLAPAAPFPVVGARSSLALKSLETEHAMD